MERINRIMEFKKLQDSFKAIQAIAFKDISFNGYCIRVLGIHYMDNGLNWYVGRHRHTFFEFHYIVENDVFTEINGIEKKVEEERFYIIQPGAYHSHRQNTDTGHIGFALRWEIVKEELFPVWKSKHTDSGLDKLINSFGNSFEIKCDNGKIIGKFIELIRTANSKANVMELQLIFLQLLTLISDFYIVNQKSFDEKSSMTFLEKNIVGSVIRFMDENYFEDIDVYDIAKSVHLSYSYLARLFKKYKGETMKEYLNNIRLERAQIQLKCSEKSISDISLETGFKSQYYFSNAFKKQFGISPKCFRDSSKELD